MSLFFFCITLSCIQRIDRFISRARVLSLDVFYKVWCTFAVYAQQFMIFAVQRMQLALTDYVQTRQEHTITSGDRFVKILSSAFAIRENACDEERQDTCRIEEICNDDLEVHHQEILNFDRGDTEDDKDFFEEKDDENSDPTFVPKMCISKNTSDEESSCTKEPKKVKRKKKRLVGTQELDAIENIGTRPRTRGYLKKNDAIQKEK